MINAILLFGVLMYLPADVPGYIKELRDRYVGFPYPWNVFDEITKELLEIGLKIDDMKINELLMYAIRCSFLLEENKPTGTAFLICDDRAFDVLKNSYSLVDVDKPKQIINFVKENSELIGIVDGENLSFVLDYDMNVKGWCRIKSGNYTVRFSKQRKLPFLEKMYWPFIKLTKLGKKKSLAIIVSGMRRVIYIVASGKKICELIFLVEKRIGEPTWFGRFDSKFEQLLEKLSKEEPKFDIDVIRKLLWVAQVISHKRYGCIFIYGDRRKIQHEHEDSIAPTHEKYNIKNLDLNEIINMAKEDGAVIIDIDGTIIGFGVKLRRLSSIIKVKHAGNRHESAAARSYEAKCLAICVSSGGMISVFYNGHVLYSENQKLRVVKICPTCGTENSVDAEICEKCDSNFTSESNNR